MVRDKTIAHAIGDAYSAASIKERSPEVHLFIEMPLDAVDVNVHPTKAEVRFRDQSFLHSSVRMAVADAVEPRAGAGPGARRGDAGVRDGSAAAAAGSVANRVSHGVSKPVDRRGARGGAGASVRLAWPMRATACAAPPDHRGR